MRDKLDQEIAEELEMWGLAPTDSNIHMVRHQYESQLVLKRMFEPMSDGCTPFKVDETVELVRPFFGLPVGALGIVKDVETALRADGSPKEEWELSPDFFKGRIYLIEFDCTHMPLDTEEYAAIKLMCERMGITDIPTTRGRMQTRVAPHDIQQVQP